MSRGKSHWNLMVGRDAVVKLAGFIAGSGHSEMSGVGLVKATHDPLAGKRKKITFYVEDVFLAAGGSGSYTEFDLKDVTHTLITSGRMDRLKDLRVYFHSHPFSMSGFSSTDLDSACDRWGKEPWRIALLCHGTDKPGYTARYVQWEPEKSVDWTPGPAPDLTEGERQSQMYLDAKEQAAAAQKVVVATRTYYPSASGRYRDDYGQDVDLAAEEAAWAAQRQIPDACEPLRRDPPQKALFDLQKYELPRGTIHTTMMSMCHLAFGPQCHRVAYDACRVYACPYNVYADYGAGMHEARCAAGQETQRLPAALRTWQQFIPYWEEFLEGKDAVYARNDEDSPWCVQNYGR